MRETVIYSHVRGHIVYKVTDKYPSSCHMEDNVIFVPICTHVSGKAVFMKIVPIFFYGQG